MKVLLFTHSQDIDGLGNVLLASRAFSDLDYELCKTFEITSKVQSYIDNKKIYDYDYVYVTDLCVKEPTLSFIDRDKRLKDKFMILDHHKSEIDEGNDKYDFVNIIVSKNGVKCCGTSLFYEYLVDKGYLINSDILDEFVELTRQYDVWDWKKNNNYQARKMHILFEKLGADKYISIMNPILDKEKHIVFSSNEEEIVSKFNEALEHDITDILKGMVVKEVTIDEVTYKIGYVYSPYKYRNDINEYVILDNVNDIDMVGMIMTDMDTVSYRVVKDVDASLVAVYFGGKGHKSAASNPQSNELFQSMIQKI